MKCLGILIGNGEVKFGRKKILALEKVKAPKAKKEALDLFQN